jgi:hypothetical protein
MTSYKAKKKKKNHGKPYIALPLAACSFGWWLMAGADLF